jgi:RNA polymerase sigma-70 factor (ECF subfamily)
MTDWTAAYEEHGSLILGYLRRRLGRLEDAEDLTQETFARAIRVGTGPRCESRTRAYLLRTAHNLLVNHRRRRRDLIQPESDLGEDHRLEDVPDPSLEHPQAHLDERELAERVEAILASLPADHRQAFRLGVLEQRPYREICAETGWSLSKVKIAVFRARKALVAELRPHPGDPGARKDGGGSHEPV